MNPLIDRANRWIEDEEPLIKTAIELKEEVEKINWKITVHTVDGKEVESYVIKGKTEEEAKKEASEKIKGKKELKATYKKAVGKIKESYIKSSLTNPIVMDIYLEEFDDLVTAEVSYDYSPYDKRDVQPHEDLVINSVMIDGVERIEEIDVEEVKSKLLEMIHEDFVERSDRNVRESFIDRANKYLTEDIENSEEEYNQEEELIDEPNEDDAFISDRVRGGYDVSYSGKFLGNFREYDDAVIAIGDKMKTSNFWPNVWHVSDHGNTHLIADFNPEYERALEDRAQVEAENSHDAELEQNYEEEDLTEDIVDKMKDLRSKLMASDYGEDPLYVAVINAKDYTEYNKKLETLRKIRGNTAVNSFLSFVNKNI